MSADFTVLRQALAAADLLWDSHREQRYHRYLNALLEAKQSFNLVGSDDPAVLIEDHLADSLQVLPELIHQKARRIIDVGSGAGFPGIPLALALPETQFTLVESRANRAAFLNRMIPVLELNNVHVHEVRAEILAHDPAHRECYDIAVARGTANLNELAELTLPFLRLGGALCAHKGRNPEGEIAEAKKAITILGGGEAVVRETGTIRGTTIVMIQKIASTPEKYPRKPGQPHKRPLQ